MGNVCRFPLSPEISFTDCGEWILRPMVNPGQLTMSVTALLSEVKGCENYSFQKGRIRERQRLVRTRNPPGGRKLCRVSHERKMGSTQGLELQPRRWSWFKQPFQLWPEGLPGCFCPSHRRKLVPGVISRTAGGTNIMPPLFLFLSL